MYVNMGLWAYRGGAHFGNVCITNGTNGTEYGFIEGVMGDGGGFNIEGQPLYQLTWDAAGNWILRFGVAGDEMVTDMDSIGIWHELRQNGVQMVWNDVTLRYEGTDVALATQLIDLYNAGNLPTACFRVMGLPAKIIHYTFDKLMRGTKV